MSKGQKRIVEIGSSVEKIIVIGIGTLVLDFLLRGDAILYHTTSLAVNGLKLPDLEGRVPLWVYMTNTTCFVYISDVL